MVGPSGRQQGVTQMDIFGNRFSMLNGKPKAAGIRIQDIGADGIVREFISAYNCVGSDLVKGQVITIDYDQTYHCKAIANATTGSEVYKLTGAPQTPVSTGALWWFQIGGKGKALVDGTAEDVAAGEALEVLNTGTAFIKAGAARELATGAIAGEAQAANSAVLIDVEFIPERHSIEAA